MEQQLRHAFEEPVVVHLGEVSCGDNDQRTFFVRMTDTALLDRALRLLYDGTHVEMPPLNGDWKWHVTCVRDSRDRDEAALREAAKDLDLDCNWHVSRVSYLQLEGDQYKEIASWKV